MEGSLSAPSPVDYNGEGLLEIGTVTLRQPQGSARGFRMPVAGRRVGLDGLLPMSDQYILKHSWRFEESATPSRAGSGEGTPARPKSVLLAFEKQVAVERRVHTLGGFALPLDSRLLETVRSSGHAEGPKPYVVLRQRQASGYSAESFLEATAFLWRFSVRVPHAATEKRFNETVVDPIIRALEVVQSGNPVSVLPRFTAGGQVFWSADYLIEDRFLQHNPPDAQYELTNPGASATGLVHITPRYLSPEPIPISQTGTAVGFTLPGLKTTSASGAPLELHAVLRPPRNNAPLDTESEDPKRLQSWFFVLAHRLPPKAAPPPPPQPPAPPQIVKMGALDLLFFPVKRPAHLIDDLIENLSPDPSESASFDSLFDEQRVWAGVDEDGLVRRREVEYNIGVSAVRPGGQDDVPGDEYLSDLGMRVSEDRDYTALFRRGSPIVFNPATPAIEWKAGFILRVREATEPGSNQTIQAILSIAPGGPTANLEAYVLDAEPFLFGRVRAAGFQQHLADAITTEIGNWTNRAGSQGWELSTGAGSFSLDLPPQSVGEAMHKRLEERDVTPGNPVDFRLSPAAELRLRPSYYAQRFAEASWNLRRILGYPGQRAPGAQLDHAQFELFYGMNIEISRPNARLAEIGSRFGLLAGAQRPKPTWPVTGDQLEAYSANRTFWAFLQPLVRSRLAVLEPWREGHSGLVSFFLENEVKARLRKEAHLRYPLDSVQPPAEQSEFSAAGLAGGWAWGFESHNILQAVLRDRESVAAELHSLFFSSLGAWGHQKAVFDNGDTTIYCQVSMGRVESINIERIGRIEPFWNRAKHVIVYRRSVVASRQFFLEQEPFLGAPILRKTEEYVELIEDERPFPDLGTTPQNRGFVVGCRFDGKPPRIAVSSRWGGDVGNSGWQVPLWRRDAAPSDVYPRPDVGLLFAAREKGQAIKYSISNPENVRFYTNTEANRSNNPDDWPAVEGLSFDRIDPTALDPKEYDPKKMTEDEAIKTSTGRFTFRLDPAPAPADVVADRAAESIAARIANVTVMRGFVAGIPDDQKPMRVVHSLRDLLANAFVPALEGLGMVNTGATDVMGLLTQVRSGIAGLKTGLQGLRPDLDEQDRALCDEMRRRLETQFDLFSRPIRMEAEAAFSLIGQTFPSIIDRIKSEGDETIGNVELDGVRQRLKDELEGLWTGDEGALGMLRKMRGLAGDALQSLRRVEQQIAEAAYVAAIELEAARADVLTWPSWPPPQNRFATTLDRAREVAAEQLRRIDFLIGEPIRQWVGPQVDKIRFDMEVAQGNIPGLRDLENRLLDLRLLALGAETREVVATRLLSASESIQAFASRVNNKLDTEWAERLEQLLDEDVLKPLEGIWDDLNLRLAGVIDAAPDWATLEQNIKTKLSDLSLGLGAGLDRGLTEVRGGLGRYAEKICTAMTGVLVPTIDELLDRIENFLDVAVPDSLGSAGGISEELLRRELERAEARIASVLDQLSERARLSFPDLSLKPPVVSADVVFRLLRAFGEPPKLPGLKFDLPNIPSPNCGFYFFNLKDFSLPKLLSQVDLSPLLSKASHLLDSPDVVNPLRIDLPVKGLLDRLIPPDLSEIDLASTFRNWGGLELANLFPKLKLPRIANENIRVTHSIEPTTRSGWLQIDADVPFADQPIDVFSLAGIQLRLLSARFQGTSRMEARLGETPRQVTSGSITGNWDLSIGGFPIAVLERCGVKYQDGGRLEFDISPDRIKLQSVLSFLADLMNGLGYKDSGFTFAVSEKGAITTLNLPLPDIQAGSFGLANLNLGFFFSIGFVGGFTLSTGLRVGRRTAPFTITVFILGGAGYFETEITYSPRTGRFIAKVSVGIFAAASLAIALGPIRGGV
ncbi:MAG TPA: hypothetical protein VKC34_07600, partial [Blastocatellia bacterium]|nr:hypothetical protein [Blastocatellia bacterium]